MAAPARVIRTPAPNQLGRRAIRAPVANRRLRGSVRLRCIFRTDAARSYEAGGCQVRCLSSCSDKPSPRPPEWALHTAEGPRRRLSHRRARVAPQVSLAASARGASGSHAAPIRVGAGAPSTRDFVREAWERAPPSGRRFSRAESARVHGGSHQLVCATRASLNAPATYVAVGFMTAPSGRTSWSTYRQSATSNFRASATMPMRRRRGPPVAKRA